ncbi:MAG: RNA polymerase subunit sigma-70 [Methylobacterium sp.]|nr:MAG: RNA polymerase subunit sigma-70 [Methylobacterium sp.]
MGAQGTLRRLCLGRGAARAGHGAGERRVTAAARAAEQAARTSYGRLVSILAARTRDIAAAEDALAEAFANALASWPVSGVPRNPEAWLITAARHRLLNEWRAGALRDRATDEVERRQEERRIVEEFPDERLKLLFVCAHPAIEASVRPALMLQTVLGLDAARIASAFAVRPSAMSQRLVRAKAKIRDARIPFAVPGDEDWPDRLQDVLDAIYAAYGVGWDALAGTDADLQGLAEEAIDLGRLVVGLLPAEPEPKGLLALMLFCEARRTARFDDGGFFVPLHEQDASRWNRILIIEAESLLEEASRHRRFGLYQCEAAIQSVHVQRPITGTVNHEALELLYRLRVAASPSLGALVAQAGARLHAGKAVEALADLDAIASPERDRYQPYWVTRWACLKALGRLPEAEAALSVAIGLSEQPAVRAYLLRAQAGEA